MLLILTTFIICEKINFQVVIYIYFWNFHKFILESTYKRRFLTRSQHNQHFIFSRFSLECRLTLLITWAHVHTLPLTILYNIERVYQRVMYDAFRLILSPKADPEPCVIFYSNWIKENVQRVCCLFVKLVSHSVREHISVILNRTNSPHNL